MDTTCGSLVADDNALRNLNKLEIGRWNIDLRDSQKALSIYSTSEEAYVRLLASLSKAVRGRAHSP